MSDASAATSSASVPATRRKKRRCPACRRYLDDDPDGVDVQLTGWRGLAIVAAVLLVLVRGLVAVGSDLVRLFGAVS